jgi:hypothetical protein
MLMNNLTFLLKGERQRAKGTKGKKKVKQWYQELLMSNDSVFMAQDIVIWT